MRRIENLDNILNSKDSQSSDSSNSRNSLCSDKEEEEKEKESNINKCLSSRLIIGVVDINKYEEDTRSLCNKLLKKVIILKQNSGIVLILLMLK